jgi:hypothetical protein
MDLRPVLLDTNVCNGEVFEFSSTPLLTLRRMFYVIGSGPTGVACAYALLHQGCDVMLHAGLTLEPGRAENLRHLKDAGPSSWTGPHALFCAMACRPGSVVFQRNWPMDQASR